MSYIALTGALVACSTQERTAVAIRFTVAGQDASAVRDLRFYLHDAALLTADGGAQPIQLTADSRWQSERVALIDLSGSDVTNRNESMHGTVHGVAASFVGVRLSIGVPFDLNHGNPLTAPAPLNNGDLFWAWQTGYKFLRADLAADGHEWSFHLGSTGCSSASALRPPAMPCAQPNVVRVELRAFDPLTQPVQINVTELLNAMRAADYRACTGNYTYDSACTAAYALTGLALSSGSCPGGHCVQQRLFGVP